MPLCLRWLTKQKSKDGPAPFCYQSAGKSRCRADMPLVLPSDLSDNQAAIWLDQQLFAGKPIYNTAQVLAIRGELRVDLFEWALRNSIAESPGLRLPPRSGLVTFALTKLDVRAEEN